MQILESELKVNDIVEGKVVKVKPFGAIISLPNEKHGLVHISHISSKFVSDINDSIKIDDVVKVKILDIDMSNNKIGLSIKDALPKPQKPQQLKSQPKPSSSPSSFEDIMSGWLKDSNDKQATLNKRAKRR